MPTTPEGCGRDFSRVTTIEYQPQPPTTKAEPDLYRVSTDLVDLKITLMNTIDSITYYGGFSSKAAKAVQELKNIHYKVCELEEALIEN